MCLRSIQYEHDRRAQNWYTKGTDLAPRTEGKRSISLDFFECHVLEAHMTDKSNRERMSEQVQHYFCSRTYQPFVPFLVLLVLGFYPALLVWRWPGACRPAPQPHTSFEQVQNGFEHALNQNTAKM